MIGLILNFGQMLVGFFRIFMLITSRPWQAGMLLATVLLSTSVTAQQEPTGTPVSPQNAYISDKLITYLYNGPGRDYKIIGSIAAGEEIKLVAEDSSSEYWQLTDSKGRTGWILKQYVSLTPVFGGQTGELQQQLQQQQSLVSQLQQEKDQLQQQLNETDAAVQQAEKATATAQQTIALLTQQLQEKPSAFWQDKMVLGSILGFAGLLLGLLVPALIPGRRRKERWM
jgi:SH3 domain protein